MEEKVLQVLSEKVNYYHSCAEKWNDRLFSDKPLDTSGSKYIRDMAKFYMASAEKAEKLLYTHLDSLLQAINRKRNADDILEVRAKALSLDNSPAVDAVVNKVVTEATPEALQFEEGEEEETFSDTIQAAEEN